MSKAKIEINTREHEAVYGVKEFPLKSNNSWYKAKAEVASYGPEELFGTKLRARYCSAARTLIYSI
jgi:hypothetical protein